MVVQTKRDDGTGWKAYKRHRVFLWVFLWVFLASRSDSSSG